MYNTGFEFWRDTVIRYGEKEARTICNNYLDMQINNNEPEELAFCKQLYAAMNE